MRPSGNADASSTGHAARRQQASASLLDYGVTALQRDHAANWAALPDEPKVDYGAIEAFVTKHTATGRYEGLH